VKIPKGKTGMTPIIMKNRHRMTVINPPEFFAAVEAE
jgi:hypothetical protein